MQVLLCASVREKERQTKEGGAWRDGTADQRDEKVHQNNCQQVVSNQMLVNTILVNTG